MYSMILDQFLGNPSVPEVRGSSVLTLCVCLSVCLYVCHSFTMAIYGIDKKEGIRGGGGTLYQNIIYCNELYCVEMYVIELPYCTYLH